MFDLSTYETVEDRLVKFWEKYPDGRIETELIFHSPTQFIVQAYIWRTWADEKFWTSGLAEEKVADRGVNSTSALENCETSAIGRALANAGFATTGKRPSREEMTKVARAENDALSTRSSAPAIVVDVTTKAESSWNPHTDPNVIPLARAVDLVQAELGATVLQTPECIHGVRELRKGEKNGKAWAGWMCTERDKNAQCKPEWIKL